MTAATELLLGMPTVVLPTADLAAVRSSLRDRLRHPHATGVDLEVRPDVLRDPARAAGSDPFRWSPSTVRRSLGLAALDACATGSYPTPAEAVIGTADEAVGAWRRTGWRQFHWEPWLATAGPGARAAVLAEATTWASLLWSMLDWRGLAEERQVRFGAPARRLTFTGSPVVRLRARADVRVGPPGTSGGHPGGGDCSAGVGHRGGGGSGRCGDQEARAPSAGGDEAGGDAGAGTEDDVVVRVEAGTVVAVCGGTPGPTWRAELALLALVDLFAGPLRPTARRAVGLWPEASAARSLDIGRDDLEIAARAVTGVVSAIVGAAAGPVAGPVAGAELADPPGDDDQTTGHADEAAA